MFRANARPLTLGMRKDKCPSCELEQWVFHKTKEEFEQSKCMDCGSSLVEQKLEQDNKQHVDERA